MSEYGYPIKLAARRTGLSAHVIRVWEKRYSAVRPVRTPTNRRVYSETEIERLTLLRDAVQAGHTIGSIAARSLEELRQLAPKKEPLALPAQTTVADADGLLAECLQAVRQLDSQTLERSLTRGSLLLGGQGLLHRVISPLVHQIGELWREGSITAAHEHFATAVIKVFLGHAASTFSAVGGAPVLIVTTPVGQLHELGALLAAATAANLGWKIVYLGPCLPAAEIAGAAIQGGARAIALSIVYPEDDPQLGGELLRLRELVPAEIPLLVGGRAMSGYREELQKIGALQITDLNRLCSTLEILRTRFRKLDI